MAQGSRIKVDSAKVRTAIQAGIPLIITTYTLPHEMEEYIADVLKEFLVEIRQDHMVNSLAYCLKELVNNSKKANTKRVYFEDKGLDIFNKQDYDRGMQSFKTDTINNIKYYLKQQRKEGLFIKVIIQTRNSKIKIEIRNNVELTPFEYKRMHDKITRAQQYDTVEQGMTELLDSTEGAGLGLAIMMLILKKIGLTEENYQILCENGETVTRLIIPFSKEVAQNMEQLSADFVDVIDGLPEFPENIAAVNSMINDPKSKMSDIATRISSDVSLTAELLKMVNSAAFALSAPCHSINEAVKFAGLRGIRNLLFSIGSMKALMMEDSNDEKKRMWDHSYKVAFYAYNLARNLCAGDRTCIDDSYVCGLLHDMGKIVFESAQPDVLEKIDGLCKERGVSKDLFERMVAGVNHGEVGARIAEKWNFPDVIVDVIRYHHDPESAPEEKRKITSLIYLSDMIVNYGEGTVTYNQFDPSVLKLFNLDSEDKVLAISERLKRSFHRE